MTPAPGSDREPPSTPTPRTQRNIVVGSLSELGASAQALIPGLYAWSVTVAPVAWSRGAPIAAKIAAVAGVLALMTAPAIEAVGGRSEVPHQSEKPKGTPLIWARFASVWGFALSSALVWTLAPTALSSSRLDGVRGVLGIIGWALFAFASAGPSLRRSEVTSSQLVTRTALPPRSRLARGDGAYIAAGALLALGMQSVGWGVPVQERAVLVRLVTVACGISVLAATTSLALARHAPRKPASRGVRLRRALPWLVLLILFVASGIAITFR